MALTLDNTVSGQFANSFVDVTYADSYWSGHYSTTKAAQWAALTTNQKTSALIQACSILERFKFAETMQASRPEFFHSKYFRTTGLVVQLTYQRRAIRASYHQKLQFPRSLDYDTTGAFYIVEDVKMAQCEQALYLLNFDESLMSSAQQGLQSESVSVGSIKTSQTFSSAGSAGASTALAPMAREFLSQYFLTVTPIKRA